MCSNMYLKMPEQLSAKLESCMYKLNNIGEIIPPCCTPFVTHKKNRYSGLYFAL